MGFIAISYAMVESSSVVSVSTPPPPPQDPMLRTEKEQAQANLVTSLRQETQGDMASLMARYGSQLALAQGTTGSYGTPMAPPAKG